MLKDKIGKSEENKEFQDPSSSWFKFKEGKNAFRILTEPEEVFEDFQNGICFTGCGFTGKPKIMCYVLDRADGEVKKAKFPKVIADKVVAWEEDDELPITGYPMEYDVRVDAVGAGTKEVEYNVDRSIKVSPVPKEFLDEALKDKTPIAEIIEKMKDKNREKHGVARVTPAPAARQIPSAVNPNYPKDDIRAEDIPF
jgi:hypothetical protein